MSQTKKKSKVKSVSIAEKPFGAIEKRELQAILDKPYWARREMKNAFAKKNNRIATEIDAYIQMYGKRKNKFVNSIATAINPQTSVTKKKSNSKKNRYSVVRIPTDSIRVGETLRIEILFL